MGNEKFSKKNKKKFKIGKGKPKMLILMSIVWA
jgi:hypothetical protein